MALTIAKTGARTWPDNALAPIAALATFVCALPAFSVVVLALAPQGAGGAINAALLRDAVMGTAGLMLVGGGGAILLGASAAWLVSLCEFPGRRVFEWVLALPLAAPSYVLAYAYASFTWAGGASPVRVSGFWGAAFIYAVGLYPYIYLAARAAFASQSACALEAARSLGARPAHLFWRIAAPMARPAIAAGAALALMEIAADFGAASHFGLTTLSTAIFRAWYAHGDPHEALRLAALLLVAALVFLIVERRARGRALFAGGSSRWRPLPRYEIGPAAGTLAFVFCAALLVLGAFLPLAWLARLALLHGEFGDLARPLLNSLALAGGGALLTLALALAIASAARRAGAVGKAALFAAGMGYAAPGAVIALGAISVFATARQAGLVGGLGAGLALGALIWTYAARFAAAGVGPIDAGLARLSNNMDAAARSLGASPAKRLWRIDLPIAAPSLAAAALILFVEILKELPATLILRPFDFDTLAVKAYAYASDERLLQAAAPSLMIFAAGLLPIVILTRGIAAARAGAR